MNKKKLYLNISIILLSSVFFFACDKDRIFEENRDIKDGNWFADTIPVYKIKIEDNKLNYNLCFNIRNRSDYSFSNLYMKYYLLDSTGSQISSQMTEMYLFEPKTGSPFGKGVGDLFDHQYVAVNNLTFPHNGNFTIKVKQYMRENPLKGITSVGIRIEKQK